MPWEITIEGLRAIGGLNARECWQARARRVKLERATTAGHLTAYAYRHRLSTLEYLRAGRKVRITLTRIGRRRLDDDNLPGTLKGVRDEIAAWLEMDDGSSQLEWAYRQERGAWGVRVTMEER